MKKGVGSTANIDEKSGCTVLPSMDMTASRLLPPLLIFTGVFGAKLMKEWQSYSSSLVLFTKSHWMTSETFVLYMDWLMDVYKGKKIGLIVDYAPSHDNHELDYWVRLLNEKKKPSNTSIVVEWIDKGLTSIYQPGDIAINKPDYIRRSYHKLVTEKLGSFVAGQTLKISREELTLLVETAFEQRRNMSIYKSFKLCGLNPWDEELVEFNEHLDSLSTNSVFSSLLSNQEALNLK